MYAIRSYYGNQPGREPEFDLVTRGGIDGSKGVITSYRIHHTKLYHADLIASHADLNVAEISPTVMHSAPLFDFANLSAPTHPKVHVIHSDA